MHLLLLDESSADHLVDRRLHECRADRFPLSSTLAEVRDDSRLLPFERCEEGRRRQMYVSNSLRPGLMKLNSTNKSPRRSRASSVFPCHSRCLTLSSCFDTSAPVSGRSSCNAFVCCCNTAQPHGDVKPIEGMQILLHPA